MMNETHANGPATENPSLSPVIVAPPVRRRRWPLVLLVVAVFVCGMIAGAGLTALGVVRGIRYAVRHPEMRVQNAVRFLDRRLDLTAEQERQVRAILAAQSADLDELRRDTWPQLRDRLEKTDKELRAVLNPQQQAKWSAMVERLKGKWLPLIEPPPAPGR